MKHALEEDLLLKRFLLGELSEGERGEVEERLFADPEYFRQFRAAEDELTDEYLYGDLDAAERDRFESFFLTTPERRESFRVAKALKRYIAKNADASAAELAVAPAPAETTSRTDAVSRPEKQSFFDFLRLPALRFSLAAAAVLIVVAVGLWLLVRTTLRDKPDPSLTVNSSAPKPTPTQETVRATPEQNNREPIIKATPTEYSNGNVNKEGGVRTPKPPRQTHSPFYSFLILPHGQVRSEGSENDTNEVPIPARARAVILRIPLITDSGRGRYRVTLQTDAGKDVNTWTNLKPAQDESGKTVSVKVRASTLTQQNYRLILAAADGDTISTLHFKVTRQR